MHDTNVRNRLYLKIMKFLAACNIFDSVKSNEITVIFIFELLKQDKTEILKKFELRTERFTKKKPAKQWLIIEN